MVGQVVVDIRGQVALTMSDGTRQTLKMPDGRSQTLTMADGGGMLGSMVGWIVGL
jgi:hypothetical protein